MSKKVISNLLQQDVYVRDLRYSKPLVRHRDSVRGYFAEFVEVKDNSEIHSLKEVDYPITPEYVNSFADSVDYRIDPLNCSQLPRGKNLGDMTGVQELLELDSSSLKSKIEALRSEVERLQAVQNNKIENPKAVSGVSDKGIV